MKQIQMARFDESTLIFLAGLFVVLSPGLLLTLPALDKTDATNKGIGYKTSTATWNACGSTASNYTTYDECKNATKVNMSGYTTVMATVVHALVFALLLWYGPHLAGIKRDFTPSQIATLSAVFVALSPGVILTLPALSKTECGKGKKNVGDSAVFCDAQTALGTNCTKCTSLFNSGFTSVPAIVVHAIVFVVLIKYLAPML